MTAFIDMKRTSKILVEEPAGWMHFYCPGCKSAHTVNVRPENSPVAWGFNGNHDAPTFTPSILSRYRRPKGYSNDNPAPVGWQGEYVEDVCHTFVTDGRIQFLNDCTHELAGQTVDIPDWPYERDKS